MQHHGRFIGSAGEPGLDEEYHIDFLASGVPLALQPESSPARHLARLGFGVASPLDPEGWLSSWYWEVCCALGKRLRDELTLERIGQRFKAIIDAALAECRCAHRLTTI
jgi:hypothetical protein